MIDLIPRYDMIKLTTRHAELLREAEEARLARLATAHQSTLSTRIISGLGDWLISSGLSLKQRCRNGESQVYVLFSQAGQRVEL